VVSTHGGGIDPLAIIGRPPEHRDWSPGDRMFEPAIDPTARIEALVRVDSGFDTATSIGADSWLLKGAHVGHDARIGDRCTVACNAIVAGHVVIEDDVFIGLGATIAPHRAIGRGATIEQMANVTRDVPAGARVGGNPARLLPPRGNTPHDRRPESERYVREEHD